MFMEVFLLILILATLLFGPAVVLGVIYLMLRTAAYISIFIIFVILIVFVVT